MRLLVDQNISRKVADLLRAAGYDVVHVRDIDMHKASDSEILELAQSQDRVVISADTDFGTLLARTRASRPSYLLMRRAVGRRTEVQAALILGCLDEVAEDLESGAVVVIGEDTLRIRRLPIGGSLD